MKTLIVTERPFLSALFSESLEIISASTYLTDHRYAEKEAFHVINLCDSYQYQSLGYYASLFAESRKHKAIPSALAIQDFESDIFEAKISPELVHRIQEICKSTELRDIELNIYFGKSVDHCYEELCHELYKLFRAPLFRVHIHYEYDQKIWVIQKIVLLSLLDISEKDHSFLKRAIDSYFDFTPSKPSTSKKITTGFNLAILYNAEEVDSTDRTTRTTPSNREALELFIEAGRELGIRTELIEKNDIKKLDTCHGLFLRDTPSVNHYTYHFSRYAELKQLVVVDDPMSIMKCSNKAFLAELFRENHIPTPETTIVSRHNYQEKILHTIFPCVLKLPDGSSSRGVKKANTAEEMIEILKEFFKVSELIVVQAFMPSEFDWRIIIIDSKPLLACRYFMAKDHWKLFNWETENSDCFIGGVQAVALDDVPCGIIAQALEATNLIGNGLYGVDLKQINSKIYVIEINESPCIKHGSGHEDALLGDSVYKQIMEVFLKRMKTKQGIM